MSTPIFSALSACRIDTHLWMHTIDGSAALKSAIQRDGLLPAVSTTLTPSSMKTRQYSSYGGGGPMVGSTVRLTPKGLLVSVFSRRISLRAPSGEPALCEVNMPRPPALDTAAASSTVPTPVRPPMTSG
jgi:hypothetical protein